MTACASAQPVELQGLTSCRTCGGTSLTPVLDLGRQPLANNLIASPDQPERLYPLSLSHCSRCGLVQLDHTVPPEELFSQYVWVTSSSATALSYAEDFVSRTLARASEPSMGGYVLEAASNDGAFLKAFRRAGRKILGVDPARNIACSALEEGVPTECGFFGLELARDILSKYGAPGVVAARNVLPHVADPRDFTAGLAACLEDGGLLALEFHYAKTIAEELHYDSIYHEHLHYFTLRSVMRLLEDFGVHAFDLEESPISGGSLVLYATAKMREPSPSLRRKLDIEDQSRVNDLSTWLDFAEKSREHARELRRLAGALAGLGRVAGYGASARSSTLLNFCSIDSQLIAAVADQNPLKQGLYTPGSHIPILAPAQVFDSKPDGVILLAWNFADEIKDILRRRFDHRGPLLVPLPGRPQILQPEKWRDD